MKTKEKLWKEVWGGKMSGKGLNFRRKKGGVKGRDKKARGEGFFGVFE